MTKTFYMLRFYSEGDPFAFVSDPPHCSTNYVHHVVDTLSRALSVERHSNPVLTHPGEHMVLQKMVLREELSFCSQLVVVNVVVNKYREGLL